MKYVFYLIVSIALFSGCLRKKPAITKEEVLQVIHRFDSGWKFKNKGIVDSTLAPNYVYFTQSGGLFIRDSVVETAGAAIYSLDTVARNEFEIEIFENTAVVSCRWRGKGQYRNVPFDENQRCSITLVKSKGTVLILSEHCTPIKSNRVFH
jgi:hypothetical protein